MPAAGRAWPSLINCKSSDSVTTNPLDRAGEAQPRWKPMPKNVCDDNMRTMRPPASSPPTTWTLLQVTTQGVVQHLVVQSGVLGAQPCVVLEERFDPPLTGCL